MPIPVKKRRPDVAVFWLIILVCAFGAVTFIAWPLIYSGRLNGEEVDSGVRQGDIRLLSVRQDLEFGLLNDSTAATLEREAQRQTLAAPPPKPQISRYGRIAAFATLGAAPLAAILIYLNLGSPDAISVNKSPATTSPAGAEDEAFKNVASLEARVRTAPQDFASWMALGDAYASIGRAPEAASAFGRAAKINNNDATAYSALGEALVLAASGAVTKEARDAFDRALELAPDDPRSRYYLAEFRYQVGALEEAIRAFAALLSDAPSDAPWFAAVASRLIEVAAEADVSVEDTGLSEAVLQRLARIASAPVGIQSEVGGIEAAIGRISDGSASLGDWILAAATYSERGDKVRALEILDRAANRYEGAPFAISQISEAKEQVSAGDKIALPSAQPNGRAGGPTAAQVNSISALSEDEQRQMIESMVAGLADRLKANPDNKEGWRMLGRSYRVLGRPEDSAAAWREFFKRGEGGEDDWRQFAFALLDGRQQGDDGVSPELEEVLIKLQSFDADDPLALYHLGHAARNRGDREKALALWTRLQDALPPDDPLAEKMRRLIAETQ